MHPQMKSASPWCPQTQGDNTKHKGQAFVGYHRYLNIGRRAGKSPYIALCNNDLTFEKGWANEIIRVMEMHPQMKSASPWCPQWCIFQQRDIYDTYPNGELDEQFEFWYCDNDYGMSLQQAGIKHILIPSSVVNHHDGNLGKTGNSAIDDATRHHYTNAQSQTFRNKWDNLKQINH
jgi:GT2 family glycosyltransferase